MQQPGLDFHNGEDPPGWKLEWQVVCDQCGTEHRHQIITQQPSRPDSERVLLFRLQDEGWQINSLHGQDLCPHCAQPKVTALDKDSNPIATMTATVPPGSSEHYIRYSTNEAGIRANCACGWSASAPGVDGARASANAHRAEEAAGGQETRLPSASSQQWWNRPEDRSDEQRD